MAKSLINTKALNIGFQSGKKTTFVLHKNINICLNKGEFTCLLGPNGAGKSTLLKSLTGFVPPIKGDIYINNQSISRLSKKELSKLISIVFTEKVRVPIMTVTEIVALGRSPYTNFLGHLSNTDHEIINKAISDVGINDLKKQELSKLSDGELQKAMIAKALAQNTPIIILDEPTAFLDLPSRIELMELLRNFARKHNKGILLSTHDLDLALQMADKVWLLDKGKELTTGAPEDLILDNQFVYFFEKNGLLFDNESGSFKMNQNNVKTIRLIGEGVEYKWVKRALNRTGYNTTSITGDYVNIEISSNGSREYKLVHTSGDYYYFKNIEDLINGIKKAK